MGESATVIVICGYECEYSFVLPENCHICDLGTDGRRSGQHFELDAGVETPTSTTTTKTLSYAPNNDTRAKRYISESIDEILQAFDSPGKCRWSQILSTH